MLAIATQAERSLSTAQKRFNSLIGRIQKQRALLASWQALLSRCQQCWQEEFKPLLNEYRTLHLDLAFFLERAGERVRLTKVERRTLGDLICATVIADDG